MKNRIIFFITIGLISLHLLNAQITVPNLDFETWEELGSGASTYDEPIDWNTINGDLATFMVSPSTTKTTDAHTGLYAVKMETKQVASINTPAALTIGRIVQVSLMDRDIAGGVPCSDKPLSFEGYYKFNPQGSDQGYIACIMFKYNYSTNTQDTVGAAIFMPNSQTSDYTHFSVDFDYDNYLPNETPDSLNIIITSSYKFTVTNNNVGTELFVDDLNINFDTDIDDFYADNDINCYPNPASNYVNITIPQDLQNDSLYCMLYNSIGVKVYEQLILKNKMQITVNTESLNNGAYYIEILGENKKYITPIIINR